jgi:hypothetical protein
MSDPFQDAMDREKRQADRLMPRFITPAKAPESYKPLPKLPPVTQPPIRKQ